MEQGCTFGSSKRVVAQPIHQVHTRDQGRSWNGRRPCVIPPCGPGPQLLLPPKIEREDLRHQPPRHDESVQAGGSQSCGRDHGESGRTLVKGVCCCTVLNNLFCIDKTSYINCLGKVY